MLKWDISIVINSTDPYAKEYLWKCWGDKRISPAFALKYSKNGKIDIEDAKEHLHHVYFDTKEEFRNIVEKINKRLSLDERDCETVFSVDNMVAMFEDIDRNNPNKQQRKERCFVTDEGRHILASECNT